MHYRNGREAANGDKAVRLEGGQVVALGTLMGATSGNEYCNGDLVHESGHKTYACLCDMLHVDDLAAILAEKGLDKRPAGK